MARKRAFTTKRQAAFLAALADTGNVSEVAREVRMSRQYAYEFAERNPDFKRLWDDAKNDFLDKIDAEIVRRAVPGIKCLKEKRKLDKDGNVIEVVKEMTTYHSDRLLEFIAKKRHPNYQAPKKVEAEMTALGGGPIPVKTESSWDLTKLTDDELLELQALREKATT